MNYCLQDILFGYYTLHIFDQLISFIYFLIFKVVDDEIQPCLRDDINKGRKDLKSILTSSEDYKIVSEKVIILEDISSGWAILEDLEFCLCSFTVVELVVVAGFEVNAYYGISIQTQVNG